MTKMLYCETHGRFEILLESQLGPVKLVTLNEDTAGPHHISRSDSNYIHGGDGRENCGLCR